MNDWWLVRWHKRRTTTYVTAWKKSHTTAAELGRSEKNKGNRVLEVTQVSGNGKYR